MVRIRPGRSIVWLSLCFLAVLLACTPEKALSPEQAVFWQLRTDGKIYTSSIQVIPAVQFRDSFFVFAGYTIKPVSENKRDLGTKYTSLYEVRRTDSGWDVSGISDSSYSSSPYTDVFGLHTGIGLNQADGNGTFSFAGGETAIADAGWVEVHWDDGTIHRVPVTSEHFIVLREGNSSPMRFVVLDENGNETYVRENFDTKVIELAPEP